MACRSSSPGPAYFLLHRTQPDGQVEIGRVLHDSMDLERHLPDE